MKRINNSDIRINILDMNLPEKFTFQFYTVDENININRTEEDVDSDGFINLDWSLLQLLGEGVLSYILTKHIPDTSYPDGYYDATITRSTNYYIVTDVEPIPPEQSGQTMDIIIGIIDEYSKYTDGLVSAETENRIEADNAISGSVSNLDERVTALETDHSQYATKAELQNGVDDAKAYTREYAYNKSEVDGKIASIDTTNYATKAELQNGVDDAKAYTREYAYNKSEVDGKIASIDTTTFATKEELNEISGQTISVIEGKGYITEETEPAFNASPAKGITSQNITDWNNKSDFSGDYNDLTNKPENVSAFNNDAGYLTEHQSLADYYTIGQTDALLNEKANTSDIPDVSSYINNADYDSNDKKIKFYHGNTLITYIDATAFIKDGMVTDVTISNGYLVITFNTDSGQEPIRIPLTDIFDPSNYYTSSQTENRLNEVSGATINWVKSQNYLTEHQSLANYYTSAQTDNLLAGKQNAGNYVSASTLNNYYTSGQTDSLLAGKQASGNYVSASTLNNYYTSGQTNTLLADKQDAASAVTGYEKPYVIRVMTQEQYNQITPDNDTIYIING